MDKHDTELEELVLKESIVSASGLNSDNLQIGIRGDPSLRETTIARRKYNSSVDDYFDQLMPNFEELLLNRSTYRLFVGFNNGEIRTHSLFDPLRQEIHSADKVADHNYIERQFPEIQYEEKIELIRDIYSSLTGGRFYKKLPGYWQSIMNRRNQAWEPMEKEEIVNVISTLKVLRDLDEYYLRNVTICMVQSIVRVQFNCDGTQIISAENYKKFLEDNLPT